MTQDQFEELLSLLLDDTIENEQLDALVASAAADPERLETLRLHLTISDHLSQYEDELRTEPRFLNALQMRVRAANDSSGFVEQVFAAVQNDKRARSTESSVEPPRPEPRGTHSLTIWVAVSLAILALGVGIGQWLGSDSRLVRDWWLAGNSLQDFDDSAAELHESTDDGVAILTHSVDVQWSGENPPPTGSILSPGKLRLDRGLIEVEFYNGVRLIVEGPADLEIQSVARVICHHGKLRTHVPPNATGFSVLTPKFELVDLGTEFAVDVSNDGQSDVHVFDGEVELYRPNGKREAFDMQVLLGGNAMEWSTTGTQTSITPRPEAFVSFDDVRAREQAASQQRFASWQKWNASLRGDPRITARYDFESAGSSLIDTGTAQANGTIVGCEWAAGRWPDKRALEFKRPGDRVRIDIPGKFDSLTVSAWVRLDALPPRRQSLLLTDGYEVSRLHWQIGPEGELRVGNRIPNRGHRITGTGYASPPIFTPREIGVWNCVCSTYDRPSRKVTHWFNGQQVLSKTLEVNQPVRIGMAEIGNWGVPHQPSRHVVRNFVGRIDELTIWNVALTQEQIANLYESSHP